MTQKMSNIQSGKILIADDSEILNNMLKDVFEEHGFEVVQAYDGAECKSAFLRENPDLALIDIQMPKIDGLDALRFVKEKSPQVPVIVMTGVGTPDIAVKAMKLGADDYLTKPFLPSEVVSLAGRLLETRRVTEETLRLKKKMRETERYQAHLTEIINEALITTDPAGKIQSVNRAATKLWGYGPGELTGKDIHFLIRGEAQTLLHRNIVKDTIRLGKIEGEFTFRKKDRGAFPGYLSTSVIKDGKRVKGIVVVVADLTRLNEVERRLKQSEKLESLGKVVEGIAHEVRNCLTSLGGFALRLRKLMANDPVGDQYTGIILDDVARLEKMVLDIEDYVRFSKFHSFRFVSTDLTDLVERARDKVIQTLPGRAVKSVAFTLHTEGDIPSVAVDSTAMEEAFYHLLVNAYDAMPNGGRLKVSIKRLPSAVIVAFSDTGVGIHAEDLSEIFNPFFTSKTTGAGMGLSKVYLVVDEHQGTVNVTSEPQRGTTVEVFLPLERLVTGLHPWAKASRGGPSG